MTVASLQVPLLSVLLFLVVELCYHSCEFLPGTQQVKSVGVWPNRTIIMDGNGLHVPHTAETKLLFQTFGK